MAHRLRRILPHNGNLLPRRNVVARNIARTNAVSPIEIVVGDPLRLELFFQYLFLARYPESTALGQIADGLVLVLEAEATRREAASAAAASLRAANVPILAAVLNKRNFPIPQKLYKRL